MCHTVIQIIYKSILWILSLQLWTTPSLVVISKPLIWVLLRQHILYRSKKRFFAAVATILHGLVAGEDRYLKVAAIGGNSLMCNVVSVTDSHIYRTAILCDVVIEHFLSGQIASVVSKLLSLELLFVYLFLVCYLVVRATAASFTFHWQRLIHPLLHLNLILLLLEQFLHCSIICSSNRIGLVPP